MTPLEELKQMLVDNKVPIEELEDGGIIFKDYNLPNRDNILHLTNFLTKRTEPLPDTKEGEAVYNIVCHDKKEENLQAVNINYKPLGNRLIVYELPLTKEEKMIGGFEAPDEAIPLRRGKAIRVGIGERAASNGELMPMEIKENDIVLFLKDAACVPLRFGDKEYKLFRENQIECVLAE